AAPSSPARRSVCCPPASRRASSCTPLAVSSRPRAAAAPNSPPPPHESRRSGRSGTTMAMTDEQKSYLQGLAMGADVARAVRGLPILSGRGTPPGEVVRLGPPSPRPLEAEAQDRALAAGKTLTREEQAKRAKDPLAMWDE